MYRLNPKVIKQQEFFGIIHPYVRCREWWIIITSNDALPILEFRMSEAVQGLVIGEDIMSWEEPYNGLKKFGALVIIIRHEKASFEQVNQCFGGILEEGKDVFACQSPEHPEFLPDLMEFAKKLSDFMNDSDKRR